MKSFNRKTVHNNSKLLIVMALLTFCIGFAQNGINYKAVIKDNLGNVVANDLVVVQFSVLAGVSQTNVYTETHTPSTDANGIVIVNIGEGSPVSGTFSSINWGVDDHYLNVKINTGSGLVNMGTTEFKTVPYAIYAATSGGNNNWNTLGNTGLNSSINYIGTNDDTDIIFKRNGIRAGRLTQGNGITSFGVGALINSNAGFNTAIGYEALKNNTTGSSNNALGYLTLLNNTTGNFNTAVGNTSLVNNTVGGENTAIGNQTMISNTIGYGNTATGSNALSRNTTGSNNSAFGAYSLYLNTTGEYNTAIGNGTLRQNTTGSYSTAFGYLALYNNTTGVNNTALGSNTLSGNSSGSNNTAVGKEALGINTIGTDNTSVGYYAMRNSVSGNRNTAMGSLALGFNNTGYNNNAFGNSALQNNTTGNNNVAIGVDALKWGSNSSSNVAIGSEVLTNNTSSNNIGVGGFALRNNTSGYSNTGIGHQALTGNTTGFRNVGIGFLANYNVTTGSNNIAIGFDATVASGTGNNQIRMGNTSITSAAIQVAWTVTSDSRWKSNIQPSNLGLDFVKNLNPVAYTRNNDESKKTEYGFIAQEVEETLKQFDTTNSGMITIGDDGMYSLRYNDFFAPLVKAVQEQQTIIANQQQQIDALLLKIEKLEKQ